MKKFADVLRSGDWKNENMYQPLLPLKPQKLMMILPLPFMLVRIFPTRTPQNTISAGLKFASSRITTTLPMNWQISNLQPMANL